ncbi:MAG: hypothetical protein RL154_1253 [Pseudomonadota bacterium]|jgi:hypothetical protein
MKKSLIILSVAAIASFAAQDFADTKARVLQKLERENAAIIQAKQCVEESQNKDSLKVCMQKAKASHKEIWAKNKKGDMNASH